MSGSRDEAEDDDSVFTFDLRDGMTEDGKLTEAGRARLMAKMVERIRRRAPEVDVSKLTDAFERMLGGEDDGASVFEISARSVLDICGRMAFAIKDLPRGVRALAQALSAEKPLSATPHVFSLGEASSYLATAHAMIDTAMTIIEETLRCEKSGGHGVSGHERAAPKPKPHTN
jgi:hypothetical protein